MTEQELRRQKNLSQVPEPSGVPAIGNPWSSFRDGTDGGPFTLSANFGCVLMIAASLLTPTVGLHSVLPRCRPGGRQMLHLFFANPSLPE
jgi:hypothetical protein